MRIKGEGLKGNRQVMTGRRQKMFISIAGRAKLFLKLRQMSQPDAAFIFCYNEGGSDFDGLPGRRAHVPAEWLQTRRSRIECQ